MQLVTPRNRNAILTLYESIKGQLKPTQTFQLIGLGSVQNSRTQDIGQVNGLVDFFLQPFYTKAVGISLQGDSYMGAFSAQFLNLSADTVRDDMLTMIKRLDQIQGDPNRIVGLIIGDEEFRGYLSSFIYKEDKSKPFIWEYSIEFIGRDISESTFLAGLAAAGLDLASLGLQVPLSQSVMNLTDIFTTSSSISVSRSK